MFVRDESKRKANLAKHGIDFEDAPRIFDGPMLTAEDSRDAYGERRFIALGLLEGVVVSVVYVERDEDISKVAELLRNTPGIEQVHDRAAQAAIGLDHARSGDLVAIAAPGCWFTYYFWLDDRLAPDYARTVDIHRKPGYDPAELLFNPDLKWPQLRIARRLLQKRLGFRYYMDVIGLDASIVKGSHGRLPTPGHELKESPVFISSSRIIETDEIPMTTVKPLALRLQFGPR